MKTISTISRIGLCLATALLMLGNTLWAQETDPAKYQVQGLWRNHDKDSLFPSKAYQRLYFGASAGALAITDRVSTCSQAVFSAHAGYRFSPIHSLRLNLGYSRFNVPDKFRDAVGRWRTVGLLAGLVCGIWLGVLMAHNPAEGMDLCAIGLLIAGIVGLFVIPRESSTVYSRAKPMTNDDLLVTLRVPHPTRAWRMICFTRLFASAGAVLAIAFVWFVVRYLHGAGEGLDVRATMIMVALMGLLACAMALLSEGVTDLIRSSTDNAQLVLMVGVVLSIVAAVVPLVSYTTAGLYVFAGVGGLAVHMVDDALQALAVSSVPQIDRAAGYLAVFNSSATLGRLLGVAAGGFVFAFAATFSSVFLWAAVAFALAGVCAAVAIASSRKQG